MSATFPVHRFLTKAEYTRMWELAHDFEIPHTSWMEHATGMGGSPADHYDSARHHVGLQEDAKACKVILRDVFSYQNKKHGSQYDVAQAAISPAAFGLLAGHFREAAERSSGLMIPLARLIRGTTEFNESVATKEIAAQLAPGMFIDPAIVSDFTNKEDHEGRFIKRSSAHIERATQALDEMMGSVFGAFPRHLPFGQTMNPRERALSDHVLKSAVGIVGRATSPLYSSQRALAFLSAVRVLYPKTLKTPEVTEALHTHIETLSTRQAEITQTLVALQGF